MNYSVRETQIVAVSSDEPFFQLFRRDLFLLTNSSQYLLEQQREIWYVGDAAYLYNHIEMEDRC